MKKTEFAQVLRKHMEEKRLTNSIYVIETDTIYLINYSCLLGTVTVYGDNVKGNEGYTSFTELWQRLTPEYNEVFSNKNEATQFLKDKEREDLLKKIDYFFDN